MVLAARGPLLTPPPSGQDTAAQLAALKVTAKAQDAKAKAQDAKIKALSAQLRGDASDAKRARNGAPVEKKPIQCVLCVANGGTMLWIVATNWTRTKPTRLCQGSS